MAKDKKKKPRCSFCGKKEKKVAVMVAGPGGDLYICDECIELCSEIVEERLSEKKCTCTCGKCHK